MSDAVDSKQTRLRRHAVFWRAFWDGMSGAGLYSAPEFTARKWLQVSDMDAMRDDWIKVGADFDAAIGKAKQEHSGSWSR